MSCTAACIWSWVRQVASWTVHGFHANAGLSLAPWWIPHPRPPAYCCSPGRNLLTSTFPCARRIAPHNRRNTCSATATYGPGHAKLRHTAQNWIHTRMHNTDSNVAGDAAFQAHLCCDGVAKDQRADQRACGSACGAGRDGATTQATEVVKLMRGRTRRAALITGRNTPPSPESTEACEVPHALGIQHGRNAGGGGPARNKLERVGRRAAGWLHRPLRAVCLVFDEQHQHGEHRGILRVVQLRAGPALVVVRLHMETCGINHT